MRICLLKDGEPLPFQENRRLLRVSMLARTLAERGHTVQWITSTFVHLDKREVFPADRVVEMADNYHIHLLSVGGYRRNLSLGRYRFYARYANRLRAYLENQKQCDIIVCGYPQVDAALVGVEYALRRKIPSIVDVRDFWPDGILDHFPRIFRSLARRLLAEQFKRSAKTLQGATQLTAMSKGVLQWALQRGRRSGDEGHQVFPLGYPIAGITSSGPLPPILRLRDKLMGCIGVAYVGTFGHTYDVATIVAAARILHERGNTKYQFILIGDGPSGAELRRIAARLPNVIFTGWLQDPDVRALLEGASVGVLPWAGPKGAMPNKFFDYLAASLPVISSAAGELSDLIEAEKIGAAYVADSPESLVAALARVCASKELLKCHSDAARVLFEKAFKEETVYGRFADFIEATARRHLSIA